MAGEFVNPAFLIRNAPVRIMVNTVPPPRATRSQPPKEAGLYSIAVVARTLDLLDVVAAHRPLTLTELSQLSGIGKGATFRILANLEERGYVERDEATGRYRLGVKLVQLGARAASGFDLRSTARPILEALQEDTGETVTLGIPAAEGVVSIDIVERQHGLRMSGELGKRDDYHATSLGKAIAAYWPEVETQLEALLAHGPLHRKTVHTIVDPLALRQELEATRARGYAVDNEESEVGVRCVAAPVLDHRGAVVAAVSVAGPVSRLSTARISSLGPKVVVAAQRISEAMGYSPG